MTSKEFNQIFDNTVELSREVLCRKADEYAANDDRLHNFRQAAELQRCTLIHALGGMMVKHTVSVYDLIHDVEIGFSVPPERWTEKIMDSINYLILLRAAVAEHDAAERVLEEQDD